MTGYKQVTYLLLVVWTLATGPADNEPVRYIGQDRTSNSDYLTGYHDGQMYVAIGTHNYQILRANRTHPEWSDRLGWTYNHAPMLAYVNNQFYCQYLSNPFGEHIPPGVTMLSKSKDGRHWTRPQVLFPIYMTANPDASIVYHFMHQRMGFYVSPNGRFLAMGFYGPPYGDGIGRVVREIHPDDSLGPIYFIRINDNWTGQILYPSYMQSKDKGFVEACQAFLADPIRRMQWWEEDRFCKDKDEFYRVPWIELNGRREPGKAFCFYTRSDGTVVGFFKDRWVTTTSDGGRTWTKPVRCESLTYGGAKIWAQRLDNGQYALVYNPTNSAARHPLCIANSDDGVNFDGLVNIHGEVPPKRFWGREKRPGPQYVRGIVEGNGNPPGDDLWVVYSVNKEDIWISRVPIPVKRFVDGPVEDDFSQMQTGGFIKDWNIYSPQWCPVEVVDFPSATDKSLRLMDFDPYDYAKAVRVFQIADSSRISFRLYIESTAEVLDTEVLAGKGQRLIQLRIDKDANLLANTDQKGYRSLCRLEKGKWFNVGISLDSRAQGYDLQLDGRSLIQKGLFCEEGIPERIEFRTGPYRLADDVQKYKSGDEHKPGWDEPGADEKVEPAVYYIKDLKVLPQSALRPIADDRVRVRNPERFKAYVDMFNSDEAAFLQTAGQKTGHDASVVDAVSDAQAWDWMKENIPLFECPDESVQKIYYYRWWAYRKHIKCTPTGRIVTEFLYPVRHAGKYNTISCALGHHLYEGRWLKDKGILDEYILFWLRGNNSGPQPHLHKYSSWLADAVYNRYLVNGDKRFLADILPDLVEDYRRWEDERLLPDGLFWQYDVRDGMEESISGSRTAKHARPTINSYMYANAMAIAMMAQITGQDQLAEQYRQKASRIKQMFQAHLWDKQAQFFKVRLADGRLSDAREAIGLIPWYFNLPDPGYETAWLQVLDPNGFKAPWGLTTAERRHPQFRTHGTGSCEWDGAIWPFATSQTLTAMANLIRRYEQSYITADVYLDALLTYAKSHQKDGKPYVGEYMDETTGQWIKGDDLRGRHYNHSTFCDLVISGLVGLCPRPDDILEIYPLVPEGAWDWFALQDVSYHGRSLTILWDKTAHRYGKGQGLLVFLDGRLIGKSKDLKRLLISIVP